VIVPLGIALVVRMIPPEILQECRQKAKTAFRQGKPKNWIAGAIIIVICVIAFALTMFYLKKWFIK